MIGHFERMDSPAISLGWPWGALVERRVQMFEQAVVLREVTATNLLSVVTGFLGFFQATGVGLMRDEEEWVFRPLRPAPRAVLAALEDHIEISRLVQVLLREAQAHCADLRVVHKLGEVLERHLLMEEEEVRPLVTARRLTIARPSGRNL